MASFSLKKATKASCTRAILPPLHTRGKQIFPSSASPRRDLRGCVKFPPPRPMVAPAWRASQAKRRLPPRGEPCDRRRPATSEATVAHGKPYAAANMLRGRLLPPPLLSDAPSLPSHHLSFGPSNSRFSSLFAHNFSLNYYKTINKITKAHHLAWHQQVCHPAQPTLL